MIYLVRNDVGSQIAATITRDNTGLPVNLTGSTIFLKFRKTNASNILFTITAEDLGAGTAAEGIAVFTFSGANLDQPAGFYEGEIEVVFPGANIETVYETVEFLMRDDF